MYRGLFQDNSAFCVLIPSVTRFEGGSGVCSFLLYRREKLHVDCYSYLMVPFSQAK